MSKRSGFTLIEVLVTVLVIGVLAAIAVPYYQTAVDKSRFSSLMPIAKTVKDAQESFWLERGGQYSNDLGLLATSVTREAHGTTATLGDVTVTINNDREYSYVKTNKPSLNNNYVYYQDHSVNYPGEIHCEALEGDARAERVCRAFGGTLIGGHLTEEYVTYVIKGPGNGIPLSAAADLSHSSGWQSCDTYPCGKECARDTTAGYTCGGTYNEDGSYTEMVCTTTLAGQKACVKITYNQNGNKVGQITCELGDGTYCATRAESTYDENGNKTSVLYCQTPAPDGSCSEYEGKEVFSYDENGNMLFSGGCETDSEGTCIVDTYGGFFYTYDENGYISSKKFCASVAEDGSCEEYSLDWGDYTPYYTHDEYGYQTSERACAAMDSDGTCTEFSWGWGESHDANGNVLSSYECSNWGSGDTCSEYSTASYYTYDANGNQTSSTFCQTEADGTCREYEYLYEYTYDEHGNKTSERICNTIESDGSCSEYDPHVYGKRNYTYDANGNMTSEYYCSAVEPDGTCTGYAEYGTVYTYDANGNMTSRRYCNRVESDGTCSEYNTTSRENLEYTYDANGNLISQYSCILASDGTCSEYGTWYASNYDYTYDANGNMTSWRLCQTFTSDGHCTAYVDTAEMIYGEDGSAMFYEETCESFTGVENCSDWYQ